MKIHDVSSCNDYQRDTNEVKVKEEVIDEGIVSQEVNKKLHFFPSLKLTADSITVFTVHMNGLIQ